MTQMLITVPAQLCLCAPPHSSNVHVITPMQIEIAYVHTLIQPTFKTVNMHAQNAFIANISFPNNPNVHIKTSRQESKLCSYYSSHTLPKPQTHSQTLHSLRKRSGCPPKIKDKDNLVIIREVAAKKEKIAQYGKLTGKSFQGLIHVIQVDL